MKIEVISPTRLEIDGQDAGMVLDVFLAREDLRPQIREAMVDWHRNHVKADLARDKAKDDEIAKVRADCDAKVQAIEADMAILGTKEEAQKLRAKKEREALRARLAELDKTLSA